MKRLFDFLLVLLALPLWLPLLAVVALAVLAVEVVDSPAVVAVVADFLADNYYFVIVNIYDRI